jgi:acetaldehyde dehydrogenase (acetylating)
MFRPNGLMIAEYVGRTPQALAAAAGFEVPDSARVLVADLQGVGPKYPLSREKLTSVLGFMVEDGWRQVANEPFSCCTSVATGTRCRFIPAMKKPSWPSASKSRPSGSWSTLEHPGCRRLTTGVRPSFTLAPGGIGGSVVSGNVYGGACAQRQAARLPPALGT